MKIEISIDLKDIVPGFLENREKELLELRNLLDKKNFEEIKKISHKIKGNSGGYGFDELSFIGKTLEVAAEKQNVLHASELLNKIEHYLANIEIEYK